jgi:ubiquitin-conjugating enzyme E2 D/E
MALMRRLTHHYLEIQKNPPPFCYAEPVDPHKDMIHWIGWIEGPENTPYSNGKFYLSLKFSSDFPFKPPEIKFQTPIYHPNISPKGEICLDILHSQWSPALTIRSLLISLCSLLTDPNPEHGINKEALQLYRTDKQKYEETVKQWTIMHAINNSYPFNQN